MKDSISVNDFQTVTRFENFGGGWGYSGHSVEAIRFMVDTDVVLSKKLLSQFPMRFNRFTLYLLPIFQLDLECTVVVESTRAKSSCTTWEWMVVVDSKKTEP